MYSAIVGFLVKFNSVDVSIAGNGYNRIVFGEHQLVELFTMCRNISHLLLSFQYMSYLN